MSPGTIRLSPLGSSQLRRERRRRRKTESVRTGGKTRKTRPRRRNLKLFRLTALRLSRQLLRLLRRWTYLMFLAHCLPQLRAAKLIWNLRLRLNRSKLRKKFRAVFLKLRTSMRRIKRS
jgi:hypothetical protein